MRYHLALVLLLLAGGGASANPIEPARSAEAAALADRFQARLQTALRSAIAEQGLAGAVRACQQLAPAIAAAESAASGARISRIAARTRNPGAAVPADVARHYAELAEQPVENGQPATRIWAQGSGIVYLRAIPMLGQPCLSCHGAAIDPAVAAQIKALYPADRATGFVPGELRGALLIRWQR